jgi:thiol:disulfide interchange protein DsbA
MRLFQQAFAALSLSLIAFAASASPASPQSGVDYRVLDKEQQTDSGKKVEVTEFFWYACPHCNAFEPALEAWVKKQGDRIVFKRVPVMFRDDFVPLQKLYYTLEAMGKLDELHKKVFDAIHKGRRLPPAPTDAAIADWVAQQGVDKQKFLDVYNSFTTQSKARRAVQLQTAYQVDGVPLIAVDGHYETSPSIVGEGMKGAPESALQNSTLQVMDWLVAKAAKDKAGKK